MDLAPQDLAQRLAAGEPITIIDVREDWELNVVRLPDARHIPLRQLPAAVDALDRTQAYAMLCHHGGRSAMAAEWLRGAGFATVYNIAGGIDAWSATVDPSLPRY